VGNTWNFVYDEAERMIERHLPPVTNSGGANTPFLCICTYEYDKLGRALNVTGPEAVKVSEAVRNYMGRVIAAKNALEQKTTECLYDPNGYMTRVSGGLVNPARYDYDNVNRYFLLLKRQPQ
jgi:hypothetical protein